MGQQLLVRIRLTFAGFVLALAIVGGLFLAHNLSLTGFAVAVGLLAPVGAIILKRFARRMRSFASLPDPFDPPNEGALRRRVWANAIGLTMLILCLPFALWETRSRLVSTHTAVILIGLFFTIASISSLRRDHANLKQLQDRRTS